MNVEKFTNKFESKEKTEKKISSYIEYLKKEHSLSLSIHFSEQYAYIFFRTKELRHYNIHVNQYCFHVKSSQANHAKCIKCQKFVLHRCKADESFTGICYAGVGEYVHRITAGDEVVGFISVSGYRNKDMPFGKDKCYDDSMKKEKIPIRLLDTLIPPLSIMIEKLIFEAGTDHNDDVYSQILTYLEENHTDISVAKLADQFSYSRSYISHLFKKRSGYTLKHYCNLLKIKDAKALLEGTEMSVSEIAFSVGFNNFSYFINTFKKETGTTPLSWKKK